MPYYWQQYQPVLSRRKGQMLVNFSKTCKNAQNVQWFPDNEGSVVYYFLKNKKGIRFYDKKGKSNYEILSYSEEDLPFEIRDKVKQAYYMDYDITHVQEIHIQQKVIYLVQIADKTNWKQLRIEGDEMEVFAAHKIQK